ncbi:MAG: glycosyltransferase family 2 protein [Thermodesulfobacteriota bacterium]|nr:glycosyltransferase family 2 protein [Thermodesulfobacteriota bacterium]
MAFHRNPSLLSVVVPVYNEQEVIREFHHRLSEVLEGPDITAEIVYVNDGSTDGTLDILLALNRGDNNVHVIDLTRNFGKEIAMTAGLDHAVGDAVVLIDADLQDPPEMIPHMVREWHNGYDVVYMKRISRRGESMLKKVTARAFYCFMHKVSPVEIPVNAGDFRLLSRRAVDALRQMPERNRFMKGLFAWIGYRQKELVYHRDPRYAGHSKWNYWALWNFALEGITSFTVSPLKVASYVGLLTAAVAFLYGLLVVLKTLLLGDPVPGYPSLMVVILFLGGIQLMATGILGEYVGRVFMETKGRPLYLVKGHFRSASSQRPIKIREKATMNVVS